MKPQKTLQQLEDIELYAGIKEREETIMRCQSDIRLMDEELKYRYNKWLKSQEVPTTEIND
jgi:uncharacterized protein YggL (DUF469 family)